MDHLRRRPYAQLRFVITGGYIEVENADGTTGTCLGCLKVVAGPSITDVSPGKVTADTPVLGVCLGAQMLAIAGGLFLGKQIGIFGAAFQNLRRERCQAACR